MSYGADQADRIGALRDVDKILKGAKPSEIPASSSRRSLSW